MQATSKSPVFHVEICECKYKHLTELAVGIQATSESPVFCTQNTGDSDVVFTFYLKLK